MKINPLIVVKSVRDYNTCEYWRNQISYIDKLLIKNYWHMSAHFYAHEYFKEHKEYSHYIILGEDVICTPSQMELLLTDVYENNFPVVAGLMNVDFRSELSNISFRDLQNIHISSREHYKHPSMKDLLLGKYGFPFVEVTFQGNALVCIRRDIVEKISYTPYKYVQAQWIRTQMGCTQPYGIMFDLKSCVDMAKLKIPIVVDLRLMLLHFAFGSSVINYAHLPRSVTLIKNDGTKEVLKEEPPYSADELIIEQKEARQLSKAEWYRIFHGTKKSEVVSEKPLKDSSEETRDTAKDSTTVFNHNGSETTDNDNRSNG